MVPAPNRLVGTSCSRCGRIILLVYSNIMFDMIGIVLVGIVVIRQKLTLKGMAAAPG